MRAHMQTLQAKPEDHCRKHPTLADLRNIVHVYYECQSELTGT